MTNLDTLKQSARQSATLRGHRLMPFVTLSIGQVARSRCIDCGLYVQVETHPAADGIDIGGPAVATNCGLESSQLYTSYTR